MRMLIAVALLSTPAFAQEPAGGILEAKGAFIAIVVEDVDASQRWYRENLGLRLIKKAMSPRGHAGNVVLAGDGFFVELIHFVKPEAKRPIPAADGSAPPGIRKAGVVLTAKQFDELFARLQKAQAKFRGGIFEDKEMKLRSFLVLDNENNLIQFFAPL